MDTSTDTKSNKRPGLPPRIMLLALLIAPVNCLFLVQMELGRYIFPIWIVPLTKLEACQIQPMSRKYQAISVRNMGTF